MMGLMAKNESVGFERNLVETGNHLAVCFSVLDMGTQEIEWNGDIKHLRKVNIGWELPDLKFTFTPKDSEEEQEATCTIFKEYTLSLNEKSNLRKDLEGWRGRSFTEQELDGFDLNNIIGKLCLVNVIHKISKSGHKYAMVTSISQPMRNMETPGLSRNTQFLSFDDKPFNWNMYNSLPEFIQNKIAQSYEYKIVNGEYDHPDEPKTETVDDEGVPF